MFLFWNSYRFTERYKDSAGNSHVPSSSFPQWWLCTEPQDVSETWKLTLASSTEFIHISVTFRCHPHSACVILILPHGDHHYHHQESHSGFAIPISILGPPPRSPASIPADPILLSISATLRMSFNVSMKCFCDWILHSACSPLHPAA